MEYMDFLETFQNGPISLVTIEIILSISILENVFSQSNKFIAHLIRAIFAF